MLISSAGKLWLQNLDTFRPQVPLILHWDRKIMEDCSFPGQDVVKLHAVAKLHAETGVVMATSILQTLDEWRLKGLISGLCFNTTASNICLKGGVCVLIGRDWSKTSSTLPVGTMLPRSSWRKSLIFNPFMTRPSLWTLSFLIISRNISFMSIKHHSVLPWTTTKWDPRLQNGRRK